MVKKKLTRRKRAKPKQNRQTTRDLDRGSTTDSPISQQTDNGPNISHLTCDYPGCKKAGKVFKRIYDLDRHKNTIHNQRWKILCPVTGCPKAKKKPFTRLDKLRAHIKDHGDSSYLSCPIGDCDSGPIAKSDFPIHAGLHDILERCQIKVVLQALDIPLGFGLWSCPLPCTFQCYLAGSSILEWTRHLQTHDLCERWKFVNSINRACPYNSVGVATCPICSKVVCDEKDYVRKFVYHLKDYHNSADVFEHRIILAVILAQFLEEFRYGAELDWSGRPLYYATLYLCDVILILSEDVRRSLGINPLVFTGLEEHSKNLGSSIVTEFDLKRLEAQIKAVQRGDAELSTLKISSILSRQRVESLLSVNASHSSYTEAILQSPFTEFAPGNNADMLQDMQMDGFAGDMGNVHQFHFGINDDTLASFNQHPEENYGLLALPMDNEYGCHYAGLSQEIYANASSSFTSIENQDSSNMQWDWEQSTNLDASVEQNFP